MDFVQVLTSLSDLYSSDQSERYQHLIQRFRSEFGKDPEFIARAPGRVNLIGEHIDYNGYAVLPMALENDTLVAVTRLPEEQDVLDIRNVSAAQFPGATLRTNPRFLEEKSWLNYFLAGYKAATNSLDSKTSFAALVDGNVPIAAGLSSSSSINVASAVAALYANVPGKTEARELLPEEEQDSLRTHYVASLRLTKKDIAELTTKYERMVGVACGGMDQAISVLANKGEASLIEFNPLVSQPIVLPGGVVFVIANSLTQSTKLLTQATCYNKRVVECRFAVAYLAKVLGLQRTVKTIKELQDAAQLSFVVLEQLILEHFTADTYSKPDIEALFNIPLLFDLVSDVPYSDLVINANDEFKLRQRALHVITEARRVYQFRDACAVGDVELLGRLMNESHASCRDLYDCSSDELDRLTSLALRHGALGARLTGAGWGGCAISLVPAACLSQVIEGLETDFYLGNPWVGVGEHLFSTEAGRGACVVDLAELINFV
jgi:N-acetylgalactosamine kinase